MKIPRNLQRKNIRQAAMTELKSDIWIACIVIIFSMSDNYESIISTKAFIRGKDKWDRETLLQSWVGILKSATINAVTVNRIFSGKLYYFDMRGVTDILYITEFLSELIVLLNKTTDAGRDRHLYRVIGVSEQIANDMLKLQEIVFDSPTSTAGASPRERTLLQYSRNRSRITIVFDIIIDKTARVTKIQFSYTNSLQFGFLEYCEYENEFLLAPKSTIEVDFIEVVDVPDAVMYKLYIIHGRLIKQELYDPIYTPSIWKTRPLLETINYNPNYIDTAYDMVAEIKNTVAQTKYDRETLGQLESFFSIAEDDRNRLDYELPKILRIDLMFQNAQWNKITTVHQYAAAIKRCGIDTDISLLEKIWEQKTKILAGTKGKVYFGVRNPALVTRASDEFVRSLATQPDQFYTPTFLTTKTIMRPATGVTFTRIYEIILPSNTPYIYSKIDQKCIILFPLKCTRIGPDIYKAQIASKFPATNYPFLEVFL